MAEHTTHAYNPMIEYLTDGYAVPFGTFTWAQWQMMQEITTLWLKEACALVDEIAV